MRILSSFMRGFVWVLGGEAFDESDDLFLCSDEGLYVCCLIV